MNCANHPDRERVAFCQNCGKPLCSECTRTVGSAVFCEPCLEARLAAADTATSSSGTPFGYVNVPNYAPNYGAANRIPAVPGAPNPVLAAVLGFIPGVGAMYNGQYGKGVVHLIVFAVLVSLANTYDVLGIFVAGWEFYQAFEAYHTARARRDGAPLPNPFGLNDIGERLWSGRSWSAGSTTTPPVTPPGTPYTVPFAAAPPYTAPTASWGAPADTYSYNYNYNYTAPPMPPVGQPFTPVEQGLQNQQSRFPVGAIWLIGLGILFFFGSSGLFRHFPIQRLIPFVLIAAGIWIFVQKMTNSGSSFTDDGSPAYRLRLFRALRGAIWVILVGVLFLLDTFDILSWGHSWPLFILVAGLLMLLERTAYSGAAPMPYGYTTPYPGAGPVAGAPIVPDPTASEPVAPAAPFTVVPSPGTSIVPSSLHDEEGR